MRIMDIPPFPHPIAIEDQRDLYRFRFSQTVVMWPNQAIPLLGYMCAPNDPQAAAEMRKAVRAWSKGSTVIPSHLGRIQHEWLRVADIFHWWLDLVEGEHQQSRGGASLGKAITLAAAKTNSRGSSSANLWHLWDKYKDVAHLITAATWTCRNARTFAQSQSFGPFGFSPSQLIPSQTVMMLPDLVIAVALKFERFGLEQIPFSRHESILNPETVWRIPADINVQPASPPTRQIKSEDLRILHNRRAGNRGRARSNSGM